MSGNQSDSTILKMCANANNFADSYNNSYEHLKSVERRMVFSNLYCRYNNPFNDNGNNFNNHTFSTCFNAMSKLPASIVCNVNGPFKSDPTAQYACNGMFYNTVKTSDADAEVAKRVNSLKTFTSQVCGSNNNALENEETF